MLQKNETPQKLLVVGPDITLAGEITACDRLVVEGSVKVALNRTRAIEITASGRFTEGRAEVEEADIGGLYEGELTVRGRLLIRSTGRVAGRVRYGELEIERGGRLEGALGGLEPAAAPADDRSERDEDPLSPPAGAGERASDARSDGTARPG